jgi:WD40-like Beta Propeller Repeat
MRENDEFIGRVEDYLVEFEGATPLPGRVTDAIHAELPRTRQVKASPGFMRMPPMRSTISSRSPRGFATLAKLGVTAVAVVAIGVVGLTVVRPPQPGGVGGQPVPSPTAQPSLTATAAPASTPTAVAGRIVCGTQNREVRARVPIGDGIVGEAGTVLGCSRDGTRLLIQKGDENLFVLHADGSETQVSELVSGFKDIPGSSRPSGATISPDGSRVVFAGLTKTPEEGGFCHNGALFAVDADGRPAEVLWESQRNGIVRYPTFSPDGTQIAFADGYCDRDHSVWVMNADGSDAHQIVTADDTPLGAGQVRGLAWSPAGDRIALAFEAEIYAFATDGSGFTQAADASEFCWPGVRC